MTNKDEAVYPSNHDDNFAPEYGLTKREYFAAMAMQGFSSIPYTLGDDEEMCAKTDARRAVIAADALLEELGK